MKPVTAWQHSGFCLLFISLLIAPLWVLAQDGALTARLDRTDIIIGETVNLYIVRQGNTDPLNPDFSVLEDQFNVLNTSSQTQMNITNGQRQSSTQLVVVLEPKQEGQLRIPPIPIGNQQTTPLRLSVRSEPQAQVPATGEQALEDVFLEAEASPESPYVQSQITVIVRLLYAVQISDASLNDLKVDNAVVQKLGDDVRYKSQRQGRDYDVIERRYAVFPERSGVLQIPPLQLAGWIGGSARSGLFSARNRGRRVTRNSEAIQLDVLPVPDGYNGDHWLPASALQLREVGLEQNGEFRVGEPLTRTIELLALGLPDEMLPDIQPDTPDGARVYADKPIGETGQQDDKVVSRRTIKQAIVPTAVGQLKLPEVRLDWWDTINNEQRQAIIPATIIDVLPSSPNATPATQSPLIQQTPEVEFAPVPVVTTVFDPGLWPYLSFAFAGLWVLTLIGWWRSRQRRNQSSGVQEEAEKEQATSVKAARKACQQACKSNSAPAAAAALIAWGRASWTGSEINNLGQVINRLDDYGLRQEVIGLQRACYSDQAGDWDGSVLWGLLGKGLSVKRDAISVKNKESLLPELYPQAH